MQLLLGNRDLLNCIYNTSRNEMSLGTLRRFIVMSAPHCANDQLPTHFVACVLLPTPNNSTLVGGTQRARLRRHRR